MATLMHVAGWLLLIWILAFAVYGFAMAYLSEEGEE
jgi:hypothetical protein